jgi:hypothetical protein
MATMLSITRRVSAAMSPAGMSWPVAGSMGSWPEQNTNPPAAMACE